MTGAAELRLASAAAAVVALFATGSPAHAEGMTLKLATTAPPGSHIAKFFEGWIDDFNKVDPDVVKFRVYHSTLGNMNTIYDNVKNQVADVGWISPAMIPGKFKTTEFTRSRAFPTSATSPNTARSRSGACIGRGCSPRSSTRFRRSPSTPIRRP
jgi:ABC-type glycerol-3-phosphate transport system substrate-binding protein